MSTADMFHSETLGLEPRSQAHIYILRLEIKSEFPEPVSNLRDLAYICFGGVGQPEVVVKGGLNVKLNMSNGEGKALADLFNRVFRQRRARAIEQGGDYNQQDFAADLGMNYKTVNRILLARELYSEQLSTLKALSRLIGRDTILNALGWVENRKPDDDIAGLLSDALGPDKQEGE